MVLTRYVSTYIITYYLPSGETALCITSDLEKKDIKERTKYQKTLKLYAGLFVIVSWISFLIPMDVIPGRMALLVTLFLVLVNIFNNITTNTPKAEGEVLQSWCIKSCDICV